MKRQSLYRYLPHVAAGLVIALNVSWPTVSRAADSTWLGAGGNPNWSAAANWDAAPVANSGLIFDSATNTITNNDTAVASTYNVLRFTSLSHVGISGNAFTLTDAGTGPATIENTGLDTVASILAPVTINGGASAFGAINAYDGDIYLGAVSLGLGTNLPVTRTAGRLTVFTGSLNAGANSVTLEDNGLTAFVGANTFATGGSLSILGGKLENLNAGGLGTGAAAANANITVASGAQVDFNGVALTGGGKNFTIAGVGPNGRGALVNDYVAMDANKVINSLTFSGNAKIGGTHTLDIGNGTAGQTINGGGFNLTLETRNRFNIRAATSNLPLITVNSGNLETEGVDLPADTSIVMNGFKSTLGAWLGGTGTIRTHAGNVTLNNGANIGGIGTGGAANTFVIGSAGKTLTINGEGRLNPNTAGFIDWSGISGGGNMRVESSVEGSGKLISGYFGTGTNGTSVTLAADNNNFSGPIQITGGALQIGNGGSTGNLGTSPSIQFTNGGGTPTLTINRNGALNITQPLSGPGNVHIDNVGAVVTISGPNTTGGAGVSAFGTRVRAGTLILGSASALSPRATLEIGGLGTGTGSKTVLNGFSPTVERLDDAGTTTAGVFNFIVNDSATPATLTFNINNAGPVFGDFGGSIGSLTGTANENNLGITRIGSADWTLVGSNHGYTGLTTVNGGTLRIGNNATWGLGKLGTGTGTADGTVVNPGGSFDFGGVSAQDERFTISGRGHAITTHGFEMGALRNNPGTAAGSLNSAKYVTLAGDASFGKAGSGADVNNWELRNTGGVAEFNLGGFTASKVGNNNVTLADVTGGTGAGNFNVKQGTLTIERGTVLTAGGNVTVQSRSFLSLNDAGAPVTVNKGIVLNSGGIVNVDGSHTLSNVSTNGYFTAENNQAAATLDLGTVGVPARGAGAFIGNTGTVTLGGYTAGQRLGGGFIAGANAGIATPAEWDGSKVIAVASVTNTGAPITGLANMDVLANSAADADRTITTNLDIRTLTSQTDVKINDGALLRVTEGNITQRGANHWIQTTAGAMGRITSGAANGELHLNLPEALDTASRNDLTMRVSVTDNPITTGAMAGTFVPNVVVKNGTGSATNFGGSAFAAPSNNTWNSHTGGTIINGGRLVTQFASAVGMGRLDIREGGQLATYNLTAANGASFHNSLTLAGNGVLENAGALGAVLLANGVILSGATTLAGNSRLHAHGAGDVGTLAGVVSGSQVLEKTGDGFLALTANNTYTGATVITRGTVAANRIAPGGSPSSLGASSGAAGNLVLNGGTLRYDGQGATLDRDFTLDIQGGAITSNYHQGGLTVSSANIALTPGADRTLTLNVTNNTTNTFNGVLNDPNAGRASLQFGGYGAWKITQNQNFTGNVTVTNAATNVQGGMLIVGDGGTTGDIGKGMSLTLLNASDIAFNRSDTFTLSQAVTGAANAEMIQMGSGTLNITGAADNAAGNLRVENGTVVLAKISSQNVHAAAVNLFINNGTVQVAGTGNDQIFNGTAVFMKSAGTLDLNGRYEAIGRLEGQGLVTNTAAGATAELRIGNVASVYSGTFISGVIGATGTGGFQGTIADGAGPIRLSKDGATHIGLIGDNTYSGGTEILQGTLQVGRGGSTGSLGSGNVFLGAGDFGANGANVGTLRVDRTGTLTMGQVISGPGNVDMRGLGELKLTGANTWEGVTAVRRGTLTADLSLNNNVLPVNAGYSLEGGTLKILGKATGVSRQDFLPTNTAMTNVSGSGSGAAAATFNIQGGNILGDNNGGTLEINLPPTLNRAAGGSVDFATAGAGTTTFRHSGANVNGILAGTNQAYATWNKTTWATQSGNGTIVGLAAGGYSPTVHADLAGAATLAIPGGTTVSTARLNDPTVTAVDLSGGTTTLTQGGILVTPAMTGDVSVQNGTIVPTGNEIFFHHHGGGNLNVSAVIGGTNAGITKAGNGKLVLTGANGGTGAIHINQGTLEVGGTAGTLPTGAIVNDATLSLARQNGTFAAPLLLAPGNIITGAGAVKVAAGTGWVDFNRNANLYTGTTTIESGYANNFNNTSGQVAPVTLADGGANPTALLFNPTAATTNNFPIIVAPGTGQAIIGTSGGTTNTIFNGTLELNRPTTLTSYTTDRTTFTSSIQGNVGTLTIDVGAGAPAATTGILPGAALPAVGGNNRRVTLEGENSFVGNVEVRNASVLQIGFGTAGVFRDQIPDASNLSLIDAGSTLQFNGEGEVINELNGQVGTVIKSIATGGAHMVLSVKSGTFDGTYDGGVNGGMYIEKNGPGTLTIGGTADNPTGKFRMNEGTLSLNKASSAAVHAIATELTMNGGTVIHSGAGDDQISDGTVVTINSGTMDLNGKSDTISVLQGLGGTVTNTAAGTTSTLGIGNTNNASASVYYGAITDGAGTVKVVKNNTVAHSLVLAGNNSYSGGTTLDGGNLQLGNGGTTGSAGTGPITTALNTRVVVDRSNDWTMANDITGAGSLVAQGAGKLTLTGANAYTGQTVINHGSAVDVGVGGASGTIGSGNISNFGTLRFNRSDALTVSASIADLPTDTGNIIQVGSGTTSLTGNSKIYGGVDISVGTLKVEGNLTAGTLAVSTLGTLGGSGKVTTTGGMSIMGTIAPGSSPGVMDVGGSAAFSGSASGLAVELGGTTPGVGATFYDQLNFVDPMGSVSLDSSNLSQISLSLSGGFTPTVGDVYYVMTRADAGAFANTFAGWAEGAIQLIGANYYQITYAANWTGTQAGSSPTGGNDVAFTVVPIPEPSTTAALAAAAALVGGRRRRSRSRR